MTAFFTNILLITENVTPGSRSVYRDGFVTLLQGCSLFYASVHNVLYRHVNQPHLTTTLQKHPDSSLVGVFLFLLFDSCHRVASARNCAFPVGVRPGLFRIKSFCHRQ